MAQRTGIGGVFFRVRDRAALSARNAADFRADAPAEASWPQKAGPTAVAPFGSDDVPAGRTFRRDRRVPDRASLTAQRVVAGIALERRAERDMPEISRFARMHDPKRNPVELRAPNG